MRTPERCEVPLSWIPGRCARSKTDAPSSKDVRSNGRADSRQISEIVGNVIETWLAGAELPNKIVKFPPAGR
jgi:hypothetical protein